MPAAAAPQPSPPLRVPPLSGTWTIEQRRFLGLVVGALCVGVIVGARLGRGSIPPLDELEQRVIVKQGPCADCAEREIQAQRARQTVPNRPLPGDVPPVGIVDQSAQQNGVGAASLDTSGAIVDNSKSHVMDPSFLAGGGDASSVPGQ